MTGFSDNIYSGNLAVTSGAASYAPVTLNRTLRFSGASGTQQFVLPAGVQNLDAKLYIETNGSAATTNSLVVSAGGTTLLTFSSFGSAGGIVRSTTAALGTYVPIASACANLSTTAEVSAAATYVTTDQAAVVQIMLSFSRLRIDPLGNT